MSRIRVLIADDSVVIRRILAGVLAEEPDMEVVGAASNGRIALARVTQCCPDVVILDVEMPELDGLGTLVELRKTHPRLPVVMFSTLTERGAAVTLEALALGASDYVTKPAVGNTREASLEKVKESLLPKLRALAGRRPAARAAPAPAAPAAPRSAPPSPARAARRQSAIEIVAIGASTGGPNALTEVIRQLPASLAVPVVIAQHMPPMFTRLLADRLSSLGGLRVVEATAGMRLEPGVALVAPGDWHLRLRRDGLHIVAALDQEAQENSCRPAVDCLFRSVAESYGAGALAVVLTGMGQDGLRGCERVSEAGGQVLAQDEATSVVWGMPGYVARAGLADRVLPLDQIALEIARRVERAPAALPIAARQELR